MGIILLFFVCHYLADFTHLSTDYMLKCKSDGEISGILLHAFTHVTLFMFATLLMYDFVLAQKVFWFQLVIHFVIDWLKWFISAAEARFTCTEDRSYWYIFGLDQLLHYVTIIFIADVIIEVFN